MKVHFACGQFDLRPCVISFGAADVRCDFVCDLNPAETQTSCCLEGFNAQFPRVK